MSPYCHVRECHERSTGQCFECGLWHCAQHLTRVSMPTANGGFEELMCPECLETHLNVPDRYGFITVNAMDALDEGLMLG